MHSSVAASSEIIGTYNREQRLYDDTTTWLAEVLDGNMRTGFEYNFHDNELYGRDYSPLKPIFHESLLAAQKLAESQPNLAFELRRRWTEMGEYRDMIHMSKGELPNTMVVVSDFPPELSDATSDVGGYNATRKQTMLRVIVKQEDGTMKMFSQSLDHSDRQALEAIYDYFDVMPEAGELLGQRINIGLSAEEQSCLIDRLVGIYDRSLTSQYGGSWYAGRTPAETLNTYDFVRKQGDLIETFVGSDEHERSDDLRYALAAAMKYRFDKRGTPQAYVAPALTSTERVNPSLLEMRQASRQARSEGVVFSGCGDTLVAEDTEPSARDELNELGYGNKTTQETDYDFDQYMHCVECQPEPKKNEAKKMCGPCGICRPCDQRIRARAKK